MNIREKLGPAIATMPKELILFIKEQEEVHKSPYSDSFYNSSDISWHHKPEGSIRISDHWNFYSQGSMHCVTNIPVPSGKWIVAEYHSGIYFIVSIDDKQHPPLRFIENSFIDNLLKLKETRNRRVYELKCKKEREKFENKMKAGRIWASVIINEYTGSGRHIRISGSHTVIKQVIKTTPKGYQIKDIGLKQAQFVTILKRKPRKQSLPKH